MKNKLAIIILDGNGTKVRQLSASRLALGLGACLVGLILACSVAVVWDYGVKKQQLAKRGALQKALAEKQSLVKEQQKHLKAFTKQLNNLSQKIAELRRVENDIRVVANLEPNHAQENVFGIGGSEGEGFESRGDVANQVPADDNLSGQKQPISTSSYARTVAGRGLLLDQHLNLLAAIPSIRPAEGMVVADFKRSMSNLTGREEFHQGLDIANSKGTPVVATGDGRITFVGFRPTDGKTIIIDHGFGYVTEYTHLDEVFKQVGEPVKRGEQIATMGGSGQNQMSQLHYEVHLNGIPVDPSRYILQ